MKAGLEARRTAMSSSLALRAAGVAGLFDSARIACRDAMLELQLEAPSSQVVDLIERVSKWSEQPAGAPRARSPSGSSLAPDEVLPAAGSGAPPAGSK